MQKSQYKVFLIEPVNTVNYNKMLVYADNFENAMKAASERFEMDQSKQAENKNHNSKKTLINPFDGILSTCIQVEPQIIAIDEQSNWLKIEYREVEYDLYKNEAEHLIEGGFPGL